MRIRRISNPAERCNRVSVKDYPRAKQLGEKAVMLGNNIADKGILCLVYHKLGLLSKRDELIKELAYLQYTHLEKLKSIFKNDSIP